VAAIIWVVEEIGGAENKPKSRGPINMLRSSTARGSARSNRAGAWASFVSNCVAPFGSSVANIEATTRCNIDIQKVLA
jgi:hypothetical protein